MASIVSSTAQSNDVSMDLSLPQAAFLHLAPGILISLAYFGFSTCGDYPRLWPC
jgi:hypothetical protein